MEKKWLIILSSGFLLILVVVVLTSGSYLKNPFGHEDDVLGHINLVEEKVKIKNWQAADQQLKQSVQAWEKVKNRIQFSVERTFLEDIDNELATMKGAIVAKDSGMLTISAEKLKFLWFDLGK